MTEQETQRQRQRQSDREREREPKTFTGRFFMYSYIHACVLKRLYKPEVAKDEDAGKQENGGQNVACDVNHKYAQMILQHTHNSEWQHTCIMVVIFPFRDIYVKQTQNEQT